MTKLLRASFGGLDAATLAALRAQLEWVELRGGEVLLTQGEAGDALYLTVSGRLRAYVSREGATEGARAVREISRGQIIGEMALVSGEPRAATVVAVRDSVLVRLPKRGFDELLRASPEASMALMRQLVERLQGAPAAQGAALGGALGGTTLRGPAAQESAASAAGNDRPVSLALLAASEGIDLPAFARELAAALSRFGRVVQVDADTVARELGEPGIAEAETPEAMRRVAMLLDRLEADHEFVLLVADADAGAAASAGTSAWSGRCARHADEVLLVADAHAAPRLPHAAAVNPALPGAPGGRAPAGVFGAGAEAASWAAPGAGPWAERARVSEVLVLLHPSDTAQPRGAAAWLAKRPVHALVHLRRGLARDMARLARLQARQAVGLVMSGGGARGFAHLGLMRALAERGIEVDVVGGTSVGAAMASFAAADRPLDHVVAVARRAFSRNPTGDINLFPLLSVFRGKRLRQRIGETEAALFGGPTVIEDLWKGFFCIASNVTRAEEVVFERGPLAQAVLASLSIPGALPPVLHEGELLCDGGTFNNFPADVIRHMHGVGWVIGIDLAPAERAPRAPQGAAEEAGAVPQAPPSWQATPSSLALLVDRLRPRAKRRHRGLPSLTAYLMRVTTLYSQSRRATARALCDVYINPPLARVGMLEWERFDAIVEQGHAHARAVLDALPAPLLARLRGEGGIER